MRIEPRKNAELMAMLLQANRTDLLDGFEVDNAAFQAARAEQDSLHAGASGPWKDAHAAYSAFFAQKTAAPQIELDAPATDEERETKVYRALNTFLHDSGETRKAIVGELRAVSSTASEEAHATRDALGVLTDSVVISAGTSSAQIIASLTSNTDATVATADVIAASMRLAADQISENERQTAVAVRAVRDRQGETNSHLAAIARSTAELMMQLAKSATAGRSLLLDAKNEAAEAAKASDGRSAEIRDVVRNGLTEIAISARRSEMAGYARLIFLIGIFLLLALKLSAQTPVAGIGTAGAPKGGVVTVQGSGTGTPIPVSGNVTATPTGTQDTNTKQVNGTTVDTNSGSKSAGTQRVVIATDQPAMTNAQPANLSQVQGAAPDPCFGTARSFFSISQTASARIITGTSSKKIYICSLHVVGADAENISVVEGTGSTCGTSTIAVPGFPASTAASGWNFAANGGLATNGGSGSMAATSVNADDVCVFQSGTGRVAGGGSYVVQ